MAKARARRTARFALGLLSEPDPKHVEFFLAKLLQSRGSEERLK